MNVFPIPVLFFPASIPTTVLSIESSSIPSIFPKMPSVSFVKFIITLLLCCLSFPA